MALAFLVPSGGPSSLHAAPSPLGQGKPLESSTPASSPAAAFGGSFAAASAFTAAAVVALGAWQTRRAAAAGKASRSAAIVRHSADDKRTSPPLRRSFVSSIAGRVKAALRRRVQRAVGDEAVIEDADPNNNAHAFKMVKIAALATLVPFLFSIGNYFTDAGLSDFDLEYGPHLSNPALRATSLTQAIWVAMALAWRLKYKDDRIDKLFAWLFIPEALTHILLHFYSHHNPIANFAFAYAFSAGIVLPGFLSLLCYCPNERKLPWIYLAIYLITQVPICAGLSDMVGPAKMRLNFANLNTALVTTPFFYGIMKRWKDVPKMPVFLATATITYQITMGIMGPITGAQDLKLYDPKCIFQHGVVDLGFGLSYAASIICGVLRPGVPRPKWT